MVILSGSRVEVCTFSGSDGWTSHLFRQSLVEEMSGIMIRARANYQRFVLQIVRQNQLIFSQAGSVSARIGAETRSKTRKKTNDQRKDQRIIHASDRRFFTLEPGTSTETGEDFLHSTEDFLHSWGKIFYTLREDFLHRYRRFFTLIIAESLDYQRLFFLQVITK